MTERGRTAVLALALITALIAVPGARADREKELLKTKARVAQLTPDGKVLAAASNDNVRLVYLDIKKSRLLGKKYQPTYLSPDGTVLAAIAVAADDDSAVTLYDVAKASARDLVYIPPTASVAFCVGPRGRICVYGTLKDLVIVDVATAKETHTFKDLGGQPWSATFSRDGKYLACGTGSRSYQVHLWDMTAFKLVRTFDKLPDVVQSVGFDPDGKRLAASSNEVVRVWDVATGQVVRSFTGPKDKLMRGLAFGNHGKMLAAACSDGVVTLWDVGSGKALDTINLGVGARRVSMSDDGKVLAVVGDDDVARVYDVSAVIAR